MKLTTKVIGSALCLALVTYVLSPGLKLLRHDGSPWEWRNQIISFSGVVALYLMATTVGLSLRSPWLDRRIGLDQAYRLHRHLGISASVAALLHWLVRQVPRWLVRFEIVKNPGDRMRGDYSRLEKVLYKLGLVLVEYAFYAAAVLVVIALLRRVPYRLFRKTHRLLPGVFLVIAFHASTAPLRDRWFASPAGYLVVAVALASASGAFVALFRRIGAARRMEGVVSSVDRYGALVDLEIELRGASLEHEPGQFAFLRFAHDPEPHPFTIAGSKSNGSSLRFVVKGLGAFTNRLSSRVYVGEPVGVEGPYGSFVFNSSDRRQAWVAGGIGITPFLEKIAALATSGTVQTSIDLWYCTRSEDEGTFPSNLEALCGLSGIRLHRMVAARGELFSAAYMREHIGDLGDVAVWFCGPDGFARSLRKDLQASGFDVDGSLHLEQFRFR